MKREWADKWIAALESGKYPKGSGYLKRDGKYCCLGVLCELAGAEERPGDLDGIVAFGPDSSDDVYLPEAVMVGVGMRTNQGVCPVNDPTELNAKRLRLTNLNDRSPTWEPVIEAIRKYADAL